MQGRPEKTFAQSSEHSKRRKTENLRKSLEPEEIVFAAKMKFRSAGKKDAAKVLEDINTSPNQATRYKKAFMRSREDERKQLSPMQALSIFVEAGNWFLSIQFYFLFSKFYFSVTDCLI